MTASDSTVPGAPRVDGPVADATPSADSASGFVWQPGTENRQAIEAPAANLPAGQPSARPRRSRSVGVMLLLSAVVAVAGVGFGIGRMTASAQTSTGTTGALAGNGAGFGAGGNGVPGAFGQDGALRGGPTVEGSVVSVASDHITLKLASGQTVDIATGSTTTYHSQASATVSEVAPGDTVSVRVSGLGGNNGSSGSGTSTTATAADVTITGK